MARQSMYTKFLLFKKPRVLRNNTWRTNITVPYATSIPELSQLAFCFWPEFTSLASKATYHTNSQIRRMGVSVWLYALGFGNLLIIRHKLLCQSHKVSVSAILWKTNAKPASLIPKCVYRLLIWIRYFLIFFKSHIPTNTTSPLYVNKVP